LPPPKSAVRVSRDAAAAAIASSIIRTALSRFGHPRRCANQSSKIAAEPMRDAGLPCIRSSRDEVQVTAWRIVADFTDHVAFATVAAVSMVVQRTAVPSAHRGHPGREFAAERDDRLLPGMRQSSVF